MPKKNLRTASRSAYGRARVSRQRQRIADVAAGLGAAFTVEELADAVRNAQGPVGLATVYRAVGALVRVGTVGRVGERSGSALYVYCASHQHHHHLVCTGCGRVVHAPCPLGEEATLAAQASGFVLTGHEVTLYGLCPACSSNRIGG